jgi:protein transport protein SEC23
LSLAETAPVPPRIIFTVGGPCTVGPGTVIGLSLKEMMRSARELSNGENIKYFADAKKYYDSFSKRVINKKIILDLFAFTLE